MSLPVSARIVAASTKRNRRQLTPAKAADWTPRRPVLRSFAPVLPD
jgi:hypothetical protein